MRRAAKNLNKERTAGWGGRNKHLPEHRRCFIHPDGHRQEAGLIQGQSLSGQQL